MLSPDLPITKSAEDTLNRRGFAESLANTISQYSFASSFAIGLYGKWGSGKTSLVNMIIESLENIDKGIVVLRFNPWLCSDPEQLITQFLKQMASAIKLQRPNSKKLLELLDQYADIFDVASFIPVIGQYIAAIGKASAKVANRNVKQWDRDLQESKNQIIEKMIEEDLKIVVSIDDIDRLPEEAIIAVFQLVKALADFPNTFYILTFDYDVVVRALCKVQHGDGKEYLEKIIQVPFEIPAPNIRDIHKSMFSKLNSIIGDIPDERWSKTVWAELFQYGLCKYIKSIRDVTRYTNVFVLKYKLLKEETDLVDLLGLTALQVFEPYVYSKLPFYKDILCGQIQSHSYVYQKENDIRFNKVNEAISAILDDDGTVADLEAAKNILEILFPKIQTVMKSSSIIGRVYSHKEFLINNNIAVPECFDRYFALTLESDAIPTAKIKTLIYEATEEELDNEIVQLYKEGKIVRFLDEIDAYAQEQQPISISPERASILVKVLTRNWNAFEVDDSGFFSLPFNWRLLFCVDPLLKSMDKDYRFSCVCSVFADEIIPPSTLALLLQDFEIQLGRFTEKTQAKEDAIFSLDEVLELEEIFKCRAKFAIDSGDALKQRNGLNFMWLMEKLDADYIAKIKKTLISDDISLAKIISYCTYRGKVSAKIIIKVRDVNLKAIGEFIDVDEAYKRIRRFIESSQFLELSKEDKFNSIAFIITMERKTPVTLADNGIAEDTIVKTLAQLEKDNLFFEYCDNTNKEVKEILRFRNRNIQKYI